MLAVVGFIATDFVRLPGDMYSFSSIPKTVDAHNKLIEDGPMVQLLMWIGLWELIVTAPAIVATMNGERTPGGELIRKMHPSRPSFHSLTHTFRFHNFRLCLDRCCPQRRSCHEEEG